MGHPVSPFIVEREGGLQRRERREKERIEEREKQKDGVVYGRRSSSSPRGPPCRAGEGDVRHPWFLFITRATCVPGQSSRGAPSRDRSWRSHIADGGAGRIGIRQHSAILFHVMGRRGCLSMAHHGFEPYRGVWVVSRVVRNGTAPLARPRPLPEGLFA
jgi:hypothetical protein